MLRHPAGRASRTGVLQLSAAGGSSHYLAKFAGIFGLEIDNDHGLNFFLDTMPTFAAGSAPTHRNADEGWGIAQPPAFGCELDLA